MTKSLTIWVIGDGKPGHENQSLGLSDAIGRLAPCDVHRISLAGIRGWFARIRSALAQSPGFPSPDFVIGTGHATHPSLLWLARKHRARSVVLMRPSLPMTWFDFCIAPEHDFPNGATAGNLLITRGALNRVAPLPTDLRKTGKMILVGGPSASHGWDDAPILDAVTNIAEKGGWQLTDSRRTPEGFTEEIRKRVSSMEVFPHQETTPEWLPRKLADAEEVWVTEDSVSMIYEALSSGAKVGLIPVPRLKEHSRVVGGLTKLLEEGYLTSFSEWRKTGHLKSPPEILREADRCAATLIRA